MYGFIRSSGCNHGVAVGVSGRVRDSVAGGAGTFSVHESSELVACTAQTLYPVRVNVAADLHKASLTESPSRAWLACPRSILVEAVQARAFACNRSSGPVCLEPA